MTSGEWQVYVVNEVRDWIDSLDDATHTRVVQAIDTLADVDPGLGRPLSSTPSTDRPSPTSRSSDPARCGSCLHSTLGATASSSSPATRPAAGPRWYREAVPLAEQRYERYLKERRDEEDQQQ